MEPLWKLNDNELREILRAQKSKETPVERTMTRQEVKALSCLQEEGMVTDLELKEELGWEVVTRSVLDRLLDKGLAKTDSESGLYWSTTSGRRVLSSLRSEKTGLVERTTLMES